MGHILNQVGRATAGEGAISQERETTRSGRVKNRCIRIGVTEASGSSLFGRSGRDVDSAVSQYHLSGSWMIALD
jgi:hypothetical protein